MEHEPSAERREGEDRRAWPTSAWDAFRLRGRRARARRSEERGRVYFVERFNAWTFGLILALIGLTLADGVLTVHLLGADCGEANPVMSFFLGRGLTSFFLGKYVLTVAGLPFLLVFKNYYLFGTRFRVGYLIPVFVGMYAGLLTYQIWLLLMVVS